MVDGSRKNETAGIQPSLAEEIRSAIARSAWAGRTPDGANVTCIPFRDYMEMCLYHPAYGYYRTGPTRVGREGDFYTSAFVGDIMGEQLAEYMIELAGRNFPDGAAVEAVDWGGGTGRLGRQLLDAWRRKDGGERFFLTIVEGNPAHRGEAEAALQAEILASRARVISPEDAGREVWKDRRTIVVANELLDAFPVRRVAREGGRLREEGVYWDERRGRPAACRMELIDSEPETWLNRQNVRLREGQVTEFGAEGAEWTAWLYRLMGPALLILIDYGDATRELAGPHRMDGTLLCYENHLAHADPFRNPGGSDLTAHVDFDLVRCRAEAAGWREIWYGSQKRFLVETGVLSKLSAHAISDPFDPLVRRNRSIRQLLLSDGMSELFKVQVWERV
ncbi:class I SAM-dependent methyltransferase [Cohnella caldifontis]|uniref:class I SAM-dependent methyltransferase n=1 Tax=Cohnella caldifontis TaxID=3027471 RepID=UPI0023EBFD10|nr:SAM-dependent methyltransferase [Cohnella sp. YIM B05605]